MRIEDLPTTPHLDAYDWGECFRRPRSEWFDAARTVPRENIDPIPVERFTKCLAVYARTDGGVCHELDMVALLDLADGRRAICEAWTDCTGWGCQDGVEWIVGTPEQIDQWLTVEQRRKLASAPAPYPEATTTPADTDGIA